MIRNKYLTFLGVGLLFIASACNDGYETEPVEKFTLDYVFSRVDSAGIQAKRFLNDIYLDHLYDGNNRVGGDYLDAASDDAISIDSSDPDVYKLFMGRYSAVTRVADMEWGEFYTGIRKANIVINNIDVVPFNLKYTNALGEVKPLNSSMKAEARFLRAHFYFELVKRYGGIPLIGDNVYVLGDDIELPRNTFAQCIDYIIDELDDIKNDLRSLPMNDAGDYAHVPTKEACMAMKARVLLYAASPLFNERTIEPGNELVGYATYDRNRWNLAAEAAKEIIMYACRQATSTSNRYMNTPAAKVTTPKGIMNLFTTSMRKYCVADRHSARMRWPDTMFANSRIVSENGRMTSSSSSWIGDSRM